MQPARRHPAIVLLLLLAGGSACARGEAPFLSTERESGGEACRQAAAEYLSARQALDFCTQDDDCVEIVPEPCLPVYYANIATGERSLGASERTLAAQCGVRSSACERPLLGRPRCLKGRCHRGGRPAYAGRRVSCWSERWQIVTLDRPHVLHAWRNTFEPQPQTARLTVEQPGELTLRVDWGDCTGDRELQVFGLKPGYVDRQRREHVDTLRARVAPGDLEIRLNLTSLRCDRATITAHLDRNDGAPVPDRFHGILYQTACEG